MIVIVEYFPFSSFVFVIFVVLSFYVVPSPHLLTLPRLLHSTAWTLLCTSRRSRPSASLWRSRSSTTTTTWRAHSRCCRWWLTWPVLVVILCCSHQYCNCFYSCQVFSYQTLALLSFWFSTLCVCGVRTLHTCTSLPTSPVIDKMLETIIARNTQEYLEKCSLIHDLQHGFRKGWSCLTHFEFFYSKVFDVVAEVENGCNLSWLL